MRLGRSTHSGKALVGREPFVTSTSLEWMKRSSRRDHSWSRIAERSCRSISAIIYCSRPLLLGGRGVLGEDDG